MKAKNFWTVFAVAVTLTLVATFAFGQVTPNIGGKNDYAKQIDEVAAVITDLQTTILSESGRDGQPTLICNEKLTYYREALNHLNQAWVYVGHAYDAYSAYVHTRDMKYLKVLFSNVALAWMEVLNASTSLFLARAVQCPA